MKAMILAAGLGTRLGAITSDTPKCLVRVGGKTMIEHAVDSLVAAGISEAIVNTHYLAAKVEAFLTTAHLPIALSVSHEPELLGTGGGLKRAMGFFDGEESFFLINADIFCEFPLTALEQFRVSSGALGALLTSKRTESTYLLFDEDNRLCGIRDRSGADQLSRAPRGAAVPRAFCGIQVLSHRIMSYLDPSRSVFSIVDAYLAAARAGELIVSVDGGSSYWIDMGSPEKLAQLSDHLGNG